MAKYIQIPFSQDGDKEEIPFTPDGVSKINFQQGFTNIFEINPDAGGEYLLRTWFNYFFYLFTDTIQELQRSGTRDFDTSILSNGGYNVGEGCLLNYNIYTREVIKDEDLQEYDNSETSYYSKIKVVSLKPNNTTNPYDENALFDSWLVDDGFPIGTILFDTLNTGTTPAGYIRVNESTIHTKQFSLSVYKRVRELLKDKAVNEKHGLFIKATETTFMLQDIRGMFPRVWSNGSSIDSARVFNETQTPALPNVKGGKLMLDDSQREQVTTPFTQQDKGKVYDLNSSLISSNSTLYGLDLSSSNPIYQDNINDVIPYNFNTNLLIKV